jgi:hypothetical protein
MARKSNTSSAPVNTADSTLRQPMTLATGHGPGVTTRARSRIAQRYAAMGVDGTGSRNALNVDNVNMNDVDSDSPRKPKSLRQVSGRTFPRLNLSTVTSERVGLDGQPNVNVQTNGNPDHVSPNRDEYGSLSSLSSCSSSTNSSSGSDSFSFDHDNNWRGRGYGTGGRYDGSSSWSSLSSLSSLGDFSKEIEMEDNSKAQGQEEYQASSSLNAEPHSHPDFRSHSLTISPSEIFSLQENLAIKNARIYETQIERARELRETNNAKLAKYLLYVDDPTSEGWSQVVMSSRTGVGEGYSQREMKRPLYEHEKPKRG